jgi:RNA polymerase sigma-70 factor, ECF subfamily
MRDEKVIIMNATQQADTSDHALMHKAGKGDIASYRLLVLRHINRSVAFAERMLGSRQDAEDVVQDVCMTVWNEAPRWQPKAQFSTWLYRVLYNACLNYRRKHIPFAAVEMELLVDDAPSADEVLIEQQRGEKVRQCLQKLPERQRAALILSYYEECSDQQAADALGISLGALQQLLFRARQNLRQSLPVKQMEQSNG